MDLSQLDLTSVTPAPIITCTIEGALDPEDLAVAVRLRDNRQNALAPTSGEQVKRVSERHHSVARLVASGMKQSLVATISGYSQSYLSTLLGSPAMDELIGHYRSKHENAEEIMTEKLRTASDGALLKLMEKLDDDELSENGLLSLAKLGLDRTGHGPTSTSHNRNTSESHVKHEHLIKLQREARAASREFIEPAIRSLPSPEADDETS